MHDPLCRSRKACQTQFGPLPGRLQKLYTSYSEASDALSAYAPLLQAAQAKADSALRQAQDAQVDLQRATTNANSAAADLKTAQQNHAANPNPQAVTDAQSAHDTAQTNLNNAKSHMAALAAQAHQAYDDRIAAAKDCAGAIHHAQSDGIHNKSWWEHVGADLAEWGGKIAEIANDLAPFLDVLALATSWIPGVDVITAGLAEADNLIALAGTGMEIVGDGMQGHWGDALMGAGMLGAAFLGGKALGALGGKILGKFGREAEDDAEDAATSSIPRTPEGGYDLSGGQNPVDIVPPDANVRVLKPDPNGGAQEGLEYKWTEPTGEVDADGNPVLDENGDPASITYRLRVHSEDGTAPEGSNAYNGPTYRLQRGARYQDQDGNFYHKNVHNDKSPFFDPESREQDPHPMAVGISAPLEEVSETMSNTSSRIEPLLADLNQGGPEEREEASETIVDWLTTITVEEASQLAAALVAAAVNEKTLAAKEAELNALSELASHGLLTREVLLPLAASGRPMPGATGREHLEFLDGEFGLWPR